VKCSCGSTEFVALKFGGRQFQLQRSGDLALFKWSGFLPIASACRECGQILFSVPEEQKETVLAE
jgi:hypothetical protein